MIPPNLPLGLQFGSALRAYFLLGTTAMCWAVNTILGRLAVEEVSPMAVVAFRWLIVVVLVFVFARQQLKRDWPILRSRVSWVVKAAVFGFTIFNGLFYVAAHHTSAINMGILQGSIPGIVLISVFLLHRTSATWLQSAGVLITMLGVIIVVMRGDLEQLMALSINPGDAIMLLACLVYSGYTIALRDRPAVSSLGLFALMAIIAFFASLPLAISEIALGMFQWPSLFGWVIILLIGIFPSFLAQIFFIQGVGIIGPSRAGIFVNLVPVFAALLAVLLLKERFEAFHAIAMGLVLGGIAVAERGKPRS